jgi:anti-sigma factor RsiW
MARFFERPFWGHLDDERLILWLDGELPPDAARRVALHLDGCETCRGRFDELNQSLRLVERHRESIRKVKGCAPGDLPRKFELRLEEAVREQEIASFHKKRTFRTSRRVGWAAALSGVCLTFAVAMPGNTARALFHQIWDPVLGRLSTSGKAASKQSTSAAAILPVLPRASLPSRTTPPRTSPIAAPRRPSRAEKEAAEVDARYAIHRVHGCMGEQIDYSEDAKGYMLVRGLVDTDARKQELQQALLGIPWLHAQIRTIEESLREAASSPRPVSSTATSTTIPQGTTNKPDRRKLEIPEGLSRERVLEISRQAIADSSASMKHAWSIRHIVSAYPEERLARLPAESRRKLMSMLMDHATEWRQALAALRENVQPMLKSEFTSPVNIPRNAAASVDNLFAQAEGIDALTRSLFADSDGPSIDPSTAVPAFYFQMSVLEASLAQPRIVSLLFTWGHCGQQPGVCRAEASR